MKRLTTLFLIACILCTASACRQTAVQTLPPAEEPVAETPVETPPGNSPSYPGGPVYIEAAPPLQNGNASEIVEDTPVGNQENEPYKIFDHYELPPPEGFVRLVYVYNHGETEDLLIGDSSIVDTIIELVDSFTESTYDSGPITDGYRVEIQLVREGVHQQYMVSSIRQGEIYIATNGREAQTWYEASPDSLDFLLGFFGLSSGNTVVVPAISVSIDVAQLPPGETIYLGPYDIVEGDTVSRVLAAQGDGVLSTGFSKAQNNDESYWTLEDFSRVNSLDHSMTIGASVSGQYYLWISNSGIGTLTDIQGALDIIPHEM